METLKDCFNFILKYFDDDYEKVMLWFYIPNISLGGVSPMWMIMHGRTENLVKYVKNAKDGILS